MRIPAALLLLLLAPLALSAAVASGDAGVAEDRRSALKGGALTLGGVATAWNQLAWYHRGSGDSPLEPHYAVTRAGDRLAGRITGWDGQTLRFAPDPGTSAQLELPAATLAAVCFGPAVHGHLPAELPALVRRGGPPVSGALGRLTREAVAVNGPLGTFSFGYDEAECFVFAPAQAATVDQVLLVGGARLHGAAKFDGDRIAVDHPLLGTIRVPLGAVQEIRRRRAGLRWLGGEQSVHRHAAALGEVPEPRLLDAHDPAAGIAVTTDSVLSWSGAAGTFVVTAVGGSEAAGLVVAVDKKPVGKLVLAPGEVRTWHVAVPAGGRLLLACRSIGPRPVAIELRSPHLVEAR